jgi:hypothetical protein
MLIQSHHQVHGDLRMYDLRGCANLPKLRPAFDRLQVDPYDKDGRRRRHLTWFERDERMCTCSGAGDGGFVELPNRSRFNLVTRSDAPRAYPPIDCDRATLVHVLGLFSACAGVPPRAQVLVQMQRASTAGSSKQAGTDDWAHVGATKVGILCMRRSNITGGLDEFRTPSGDGGVLAREIAPGFMAVYDDPDALHRVTDIASADGASMGVRDVVTFSWTRTEPR